MKLILSIIAMLAIMLSSTVFAASMASPAGLWKSYDDDGQATGYVRISEMNGIYTGVIEQIIEAGEEYCSACKDERNGQKLIGMAIIKNIKAKNEGFGGGEILDPYSGNIYRVKLKLKDAGKKMEVRGFIGISLLGRTQVWERVVYGE
jgi:uncharacterized protein (DUF2147 family)